MGRLLLPKPQFPCLSNVDNRPTCLACHGAPETSTVPAESKEVPYPVLTALTEGPDALWLQRAPPKEVSALQTFWAS